MARSGGVLERRMWSRPGSGSIHVTFDLPVGDVDRIGGPIRPEEQSQIESIARAELETAYAGLRIRFTGQPRASIASASSRIFLAVACRWPEPRGALPSAAASAPSTFGRWATRLSPMRRATPIAPRIIEAIGKGHRPHRRARIRAPDSRHVNMHDTKDPDSYENGISNRPSQFYGTLHWAFARPLLAQTLGQKQVCEWRDGAVCSCATCCGARCSRVARCLAAAS